MSDPNTTNRNWRLFVDESGQFSDEHSHVHCAGLLVERDISGSQPDAIKAELVNLAPEFSWPLHAAFLNVPGMYVLAPYAHGKTPRYKMSARVLRAQDVVARLLATQAADTKHVLDLLVDGKDPSMPVLRRVDDAIANALPETYAALDNRLAEVRAGFRRILENLSRFKSDTTVTASLFLSVEKWVGAASDSTIEARRRDSLRYDQLLLTLFRQVDRTLCNSIDVQHVQAQVLTRHRHEASSPRPVYVDRRHVESIVHGAIPVARDVRLTVEGVYPFNPRANGGLVLADFVSTAAFAILKNNPNKSLGFVHKRLRASIGLPVVSGSPPRSHIGCATASALRTQVTSRRWASEACAEWETTV